jgi:prepilin signal peptidase PulO-like enzyme (type II secretory pathway)
MIDYLPDLLIIVYSGLLGLLIASFLNVVIYRLPQGETIVQGRSHCMTCGHALGALDLLPVFSYLLLDRRCRYCREPISSRYIKVELAGGVFFALAAWVNRPYVNLSAVLSLIVICALFCLLLVDSMIRFDGHKLVPPAIIFVSLILAAFPLVQALAANTLDGVEIANRLSGLVLGLMTIPLMNSLQPAANAKFSLVLALPVAGLWLGLPLMLLILLPSAAGSWLLKKKHLVPLISCILFFIVALLSAVIFKGNTL